MRKLMTRAEARKAAHAIASAAIFEAINCGAGSRFSEANWPRVDDALRQMADRHGLQEMSMEEEERFM